jgi:hypothetical protein
MSKLYMNPNITENTMKGTGVKYYKTWHFQFRNNQHFDKRG